MKSILCKAFSIVHNQITQCPAIVHTYSREYVYVSSLIKQIQVELLWSDQHSGKYNLQMCKGMCLCDFLFGVTNEIFHVNLILSFAKLTQKYN